MIAVCGSDPQLQRLPLLSVQRRSTRVLPPALSPPRTKRASAPRSHPLFTRWIHRAGGAVGTGGAGSILRIAAIRQPSFACDNVNDVHIERVLPPARPAIS